MKKLIIISILLLVSFSYSIAQQGNFYQFKLTGETKLKGDKVFIEDLVNEGDETPLDINNLFKERLETHLKPYGKGNKKAKNFNATSHEGFFKKTDNKEDANVVVGGTYFIETNSDVEEKLFYETQTNLGAAIPFYEIRQKNSVKIQLAISYTYKDNSTVYDTIYAEKYSERKPGKKFYSIEELLEDCEKNISSDLYRLFSFYETNYTWYKFEKKVKTKNKELKEKLKGAKDLLKEGKIYELGSLYKQAYEEDNSNQDAAYNLAMCYELIGNYPKAEEFYAKRPDFHTKTRMKSNMEFYRYMESIGANLILRDFD